MEPGGIRGDDGRPGVRLLEVIGPGKDGGGFVTVWQAGVCMGWGDGGVLLVIFIQRGG